jgi:hypothetical protein
VVIPVRSSSSAGRSWRANDFKIWRIYFNASEDRFVHHPVSPWLGVGTSRVVRFAGDIGRLAHERLVALLRVRGKAADGPLDMEPFEVIRDLLRDGDLPSIGGAPQLVKVYRHLNTQMFGVSWPRSGGPICVAGRPLLEYEHAEVPVVDPDNPTTLPIHS